MKKYLFNKQINNKLRKFKKYLQNKNYVEDTIKQKLNYAGYFLQFLENENLKPKEVKYPEMLAFIEILSSENKSKRLINNNIYAIRNYYEYLRKSGKTPPSGGRGANPAVNLTIKGVQRKLPRDILKYDFLEKIYKEYPENCKRTKRNKIILGLYVYQAVKTGEINKLKIEDINLENGTIYISGSRKSNSRTLELRAFQIMQLHKLTENTESEKLFIGTKNAQSIKAGIELMFKELNQKYPELKNAKQIRTSVIVNKLKTHNLREVQHFAGHRYVSSTEKYLINNIEDLKKETEKYHPLNDLKM